MTFIVLFIIISLVVAFITTENPIKLQNEKKEKLKLLIKDNVIEQGKTYTNEDFSKTIIIDELNKKVHLLNILENKCSNYNYEDIIQSEIIIDGNTISSTNIGNQLVGSVVGGLIAGIPGMLIGGLSGKKTSKETVKNIELKLTLNDMDNSIFKINFLQVTKYGWSKESAKIKDVLTNIEKWQGYFDIILRQQNNVV